MTNIPSASCFCLRVGNWAQSLRKNVSRDGDLCGYLAARKTAATEVSRHGTGGGGRIPTSMEGSRVAREGNFPIRKGGCADTGHKRNVAKCSW